MKIITHNASLIITVVALAVASLVLATSPEPVDASAFFHCLLDGSEICEEYTGMQQNLCTNQCPGVEFFCCS